MQGHGDTQHLGGAEIDDEPITVCSLNWKVPGLRALENAVDVGRRLSLLIDQLDGVAIS